MQAAAPYHGQISEYAAVAALCGTCAAAADVHSPVHSPFSPIEGCQPT